MTTGSGEKKCAACGKEEESDESQNNKLKQCSVCHAVEYCSTGCQKNHWSSHKNACTKTAALTLFAAIQANDVDTIKRLATTKRVVRGKVD